MPVPVPVGDGDGDGDDELEGVGDGDGTTNSRENTMPCIRQSSTCKGVSSRGSSSPEMIHTLSMPLAGSIYIHAPFHSNSTFCTPLAVTALAKVGVQVWKVSTFLEE